MDFIFVALYGICFAVIAGGAFALMRQGIQVADQSRVSSRPRRSSSHPEAPAVGEDVLYVDLSRERLESLYNQAS